MVPLIPGINRGPRAGSLVIRDDNHIGTFLAVGSFPVCEVSNGLPRTLLRPISPWRCRT